MISLYQLPKTKDKQYSLSPFCAKLELYLKYMNIPYEAHYNFEFNKSPTGKMPFIQTQGKKFADSALIIEMLEDESGNSIDKHLTTEQKAQAWAFIKMCEESLHWFGVYGRWVDRDNTVAWKKLLCESSGMPKFMVTMLYPAMKRGVAKQLRGQGTTILSNREIYHKAEKDIKAISSFLDGRGYFFNDKVSLVDIVAYSFLKMFRDGTCGNRLQNIFEQNSLDSFISNMSSVLNR